MCRPTKLATIAGLLALSTGCIFGGGGGESGADSGPDGANFHDAGDGGGVDDSAGGLDSATPIDAGPMNDSGGPDVGSGDEWHHPGFGNRRLVSWRRFGPDASDVTVPVEVPDGSSGAAASTPGGTPLAVERDGATAWVLLPTFGESGEFWLYFDGEGDTRRDAWPNSVGVYHFSSEGAPLAAAVGNPLASPVGVALGDGVVGSGFLVPEGEPIPEAGLTAGNVSAATLGNEFMIEMWYRGSPAVDNAYDNLLFSTYGASKVTVFFEEPLVVGYAVQSGAQEWINPDSQDAPSSAGVFNHLALVVRADPPEVTMYVNGFAPPPTEADRLAGWQPSGQTFSFGGPAWSGGGAIDEVRIHAEPRDSDYIAAVIESFGAEFFEYGPVETQP